MAPFILVRDARRLCQRHPVQRERSAPAAGVFQCASFAPAALAAHPDTALLVALDYATELKDEGERARRDGEGTYRDWILDKCVDFIEVDGRIAEMPARTLLGARAKAAYAMDGFDGPAKGVFAVAYAALRDLMALGDGPVPGGRPQRRRSA